jgi:hypothetical protein
LIPLKNLSPALPSREGSKNHRKCRLLPSLEGRAGERFFIENFTKGQVRCGIMGV